MSRMSNRKEPTSLGSSIVINVGSRKSQLALIQTSQVVSRLEDFYLNNPDRLKPLFPDLFNDKDEPGLTKLKFNVVSMTTIGDKVQDKPLPEIGAKSLFTKELEVELVDGNVDMIVHSLKDLPTTLPEGCVIGAVMKRDSPDDAIVLKNSLIDKVNPLDLLLGREPNYMDLKIGTSSQRRIAMIHRCNPNIACADIRGNLNTRLAKLDKEGEYSAIILARAGLDRMGWKERCSSMLTPEIDPGLSDWLYAVGQGAIAVECRSTDEHIMRLISPIVDLKTTYEVIAERTLMRTLEGGCSVPLGVRSTWIDGQTLDLVASVLSVDGLNCVRASGRTEIGQAPKTSNCQFSCEETSTFSCIALPFQSDTLRTNFERSHELGSSVANKMISMGCLELIRRER